MSRLKGIREFFWPILEPKSEAFKASEKQRLTNDKAAITKLALSKSVSVALEEARRFADAEEDRRRVADQKATTYLAVVAALVPLVVTLATAVWDKKAGGAPTWVNMLMLGMAVAYASKAGLHAFRVLEVSASHRIGIADFTKAWKEPKPERELARDILRCGRMNQAGVNDKVTGIKMAHAFLLRAFLTFAGLLMFNIAWFIGTAIWTGWFRPADPWLATPQAALSAGIEAAELHEVLGANAAWRALASRCAAQGGMFTITLESDAQVAAPDTLQRGLRMAATDQLRLRKLQLRCGSASWAQLNLWGVTARLSPPGGRDPLGAGAARPEHLAIRQLWPAPDRNVQSAPSALLRQSMKLSLPNGTPVAHVEVTVLEAAIAPPSSR